MRQALELALEALELMYACYKNPKWVSYKQQEQKILEQTVDTITAIKEALAQPEQEPFGHVTVRRLSQRFENHHDQFQFYPAGQSPYLDNVDECYALYTTPPQPEQKPMAKLQVTLEDRPIDIELAQYKRMFEAACSELGAINEALGLDPNDGGAEPILFAIEQLRGEPQEPVAWMCSDFNLMHRGYSRFSPTRQGEWNIPLYTTPPQRKPLTDKEIILIVAECAASHQHTDIHFARAIERAHGIKE